MPKKSPRRTDPAGRCRSNRSSPRRLHRPRQRSCPWAPTHVARLRTTPGAVRRLHAHPFRITEAKFSAALSFAPMTKLPHRIDEVCPGQATSAVKQPTNRLSRALPAQRSLDLMLSVHRPTAVPGEIERVQLFFQGKGQGSPAQALGQGHPCFPCSRRLAGEPPALPGR